MGWYVQLTTALPLDLLLLLPGCATAPLQVMIKDKALCFRTCTVKSIKEHQAVVFDEE